MIPWETIWKTDPFKPGSFSVAAPNITIPIWLTEEYATMYFRSICHMAERAPYTMLIVAMVPTSQTHSVAPCGMSCMPTRTTPYAPSFIKTPA